jgi:hypothetical protein
MTEKFPTENVAAQDLATIQETLSSLIVRHQGLQDAYDLINKTIDTNQYLSENRHVIIIGESGCGKSTLMDMYQGDHCPSIEEFQLGTQANIPAIFASVPSPVTPRSMSVELIKATGDKTGLTQTAQRITERLCVNLKGSKTRVVFMDECQHLLSLGGNSKKHVISTRLRESLDWIKSLTNRTAATYVLLGMPELLDVIRADDQLARRFTNTVYLGPFHPPRDKDSLMIKFTDDLLLKTSEIILELYDDEYFKEIDYFQDHLDDAIRLYAATKGSPSQIKLLVINAACIAYSEESRKIEMSHFSKAFENLEKASIEAEKAALASQEMKLKINENKGRDYINPFTLKLNLVENQLSELAA